MILFVILNKTNVDIIAPPDESLPPSDGLSKINYIKQSTNLTTGDPFQTFEIEATNLPPVECVFIQITVADTTQPSDNTCDGWDGTKRTVNVPNAEFTAQVEHIKVLIIANDQLSNVIDISTITFDTSSKYNK